MPTGIAGSGSCLAAPLFAAFFILGFFGRDVLRRAPIPARVVADDGRVLLTRDDILTGQQVWQSTGGQQRIDLGSRRLSGPGLVGRLAPSRGEHLARRYGRKPAAPRRSRLDESGQAVLRDRRVPSAQHARRGRRRAGLGGPRRSDGAPPPTTTRSTAAMPPAPACARPQSQSIVVPDPARRAR